LDPKLAEPVSPPRHRPVEIVSEKEKQVSLTQTPGVVSVAAGVALIAASRRRVAT
jgi:hypothetical protein